MATTPEGFQTITPSLTLDNAAKAIELYVKALGAKEESRMTDPKSGKIMHAVLQIGTSKLFVADTNPAMGCGAATSSGFYLYLPDADAACKQAVAAGMTEKHPPSDMFWGDRLGAVSDPFGVTWTLATHVRDVSPADMEKGREAFMKKIAA